MGLVDYFIIGALSTLTIIVLTLLYDKIKEREEIKSLKKKVTHSEKLLRGSVKFAESVGAGNFDDEYVPEEDDVLGNALLLMRANLKAASIEDASRNWISEGISKFSTILRTESDVSQLTDQLCSELVTYMEANQCQIYFINNENKEDIYLELKASYAWDRNKYKNQRIEITEGLAGRCFLEKDKILLKNTPQDYINLTSGLGDTNPSNILILPIKIDDDVYGILEIASFQEFENHQIEFIERLSENIASMISGIKNNEKTQQLLLDMEAAKQDSILYQQEMDAQLSVMNNVISISKLDLEGNIMYVNEKLLEVTGYDEKDIIGEGFQSLKSENEKENTYLELWETVQEGNVWTGRLIDVAKNGLDKHSDAIVAPLKDSDEKINSIHRH